MSFSWYLLRYKQLEVQVRLQRYFWHPMESSGGVRKNIQALTVPERKQFFWCLKMFGILPAFKQNENRYMWSLAYPGSKAFSEGDQEKYFEVHPKCLHDEMMANHSTCCEHVSFFFGYYHRHLMFHFEMRLNYVDECLRLTQEEFAAKFPTLWAVDAQLWKNILVEYKLIAPIKAKVMAHYWSPTNYNNRDDIVIPIEISDPKFYPHEMDMVDQMFQKVRKHYSYEVNAKTRWMKNEADFEQRRPEIEKTLLGKNYFHSEYTPTTNEANMVNGDFTPRSQTNFQTFYETYEQWADMHATDYLPNSMKLSASRNYAKWQESNQKVNLFNQNEGEILTNYGGKFNQAQKTYNMQYFNSSELQGNVTDINKVNYNNFLPHYQLGYALFNEDFSSLTEYLDPTTGKSFERPHNTMHNNMHFCMMDDNFSLTNFVFYLYHGWIDAMLEMKIRLCDTEAEGYKLFVKMDSESKREEYFDPILNPNLDSKKYGDYPIIEWADPLYVNTNASNRFDEDITFADRVKLCQDLGLTESSIKVAFPAQSFYLKDNVRIRTSLDLDQFYKSEYIPNNIAVFAEFAGFADYNANHDYEIFETLYTGTTLSNDTYMLGSLPDLRIPKYLTDMQAQVNGYRESISQFIHSYAKTTELKTSLKPYFKLVVKGLLLLVKYRSTLPNGTYVLKADLSELVKQLERREITEHTAHDQLNNEERACLNREIGFSVFTIFGKGSEANRCINCGEDKTVIVNVNEELYSRFPKLWSWLNKTLLREVVIDNQDKGFQQIPQKDTLDVNEFMRIKHQKGFKISSIQGAEQIQMEVIILANEGQLDKLNMEISADTIRVENGKPNSDIFKDFLGEDFEYSEEASRVHTLKGNQRAYACSFNFYNMRDNHKKLARGELDGLIYNKVHVNVYLDGVSETFAFFIKQYHELMRYQMVISKENNKLKVKVIDADYQFKKLLFESQLK